MSHDCPECGQMCYCDGEDVYMDTQENYINCTHYLSDGCEDFDDE